MDNKINFTGTFLIKNPTKAAKIELEKLAGRHKLIFKNFDNTTDNLYVVRKGKDKGIAKFILDNNLRFKYYPWINTKSGLDPLCPDEAIKVLEQDVRMISQKSALAKFFRFLPKPPRIDYNLKGVARSLNLIPDELVFRSENGATLAFSKENKQLFKSSPLNKYGENYVYSFINGGKPEKLLVHGDVVLFKYPYYANFFDKNFKDCVNMALSSQL